MVFILHLVCGTLLTSPLSRFVAVLSVVRGAYMRARRAAPGPRGPRAPAPAAPPRRARAGARAE